MSLFASLYCILSMRQEVCIPVAHAVEPQASAADLQSYKQQNNQKE